MSATSFDPAPAHRFFAADCFNRTWGFLDRPDCSPADSLQMLLLAHASLWHWTQREDVTPRHLSIGCWQISRVHAVLGHAEEARRFGELSLQHAPADDAFTAGFAREALARAASVAGDSGKRDHHLSEARRLAALVTETDDRALLETDLSSIL